VCVGVYLRTNSDYFPIQHWLTGLYNRDGVCLLRGTDWVFIYNSGYVFCVDLRTNSDCFSKQHELVGFYNPVCILRGTKLYLYIKLTVTTEAECVYCAARTECLSTFQVNFHFYVLCMDLRTKSDCFLAQHERLNNTVSGCISVTMHVWRAAWVAESCNFKSRSQHTDVY